MKPSPFSIVCDGLFHRVSFLLGIFELPLVLFIFLVQLLMNRTPLSSVCDGPLPSANPFLVQVLS